MYVCMFTGRLINYVSVAITYIASSICTASTNYESNLKSEGNGKTVIKHTLHFIYLFNVLN